MPFSKIFLLAVVFKVLFLAVVLGYLCDVFWQHHLLSHSGARDFEKERKYIDLFTLQGFLLTFLVVYLPHTFCVVYQRALSQNTQSNLSSQRGSINSQQMTPTSFRFNQISTKRANIHLVEIIIFNILEYFKRRNPISKANKIFRPNCTFRHFV